MIVLGLEGEARWLLRKILNLKIETKGEYLYPIKWGIGFKGEGISKINQDLELD